MADEREIVRVRGEGAEQPLLGALLRRRREDIIGCWERRLRQWHESAEVMTQPLLRDHLSEILGQLADLVEGDRASVRGRETMAHARLRFEQGFDLAEVVQEYSILRLSILEELSAELPRVPNDQVARLNEGVDRAIALAVGAHQQISNQVWNALDRISEIGFVGRNVEEVLNRLVRVVAEVASVDEVTILLREGNRLRRRATFGLDVGFEIGFSLEIGEGFAGTIAATRQPLTLDHDSAARLVRSELLRAIGSGELYGVPLVDGDDVLGVAHIGSRRGTISEQDKLLFRTMASRATLVIAHAVSQARERAANAATRAFAVASCLDDAAENLLRSIGETFGWDTGNYWRLDDSDGLLRHVKHWAADGARFPQLEAATKGLVFQPGEGLPGRAWKSGEPEWVSEITDEPTFPRSAAALADGLRSAIAFPLRSGDRTVGVLELLSRSRRSAAEEAVEMTRAVAGQLTGLLARLTAEEEVRRSEAHMAAILGVALDCIVSMDATGRVIAWNPAAEQTFGYTSEEALGEPLANLIIPAQMRDSHWKGLEHYLATGESRILGRRFDTFATRRDGKEFPVELAIHRVPGENPPQFTGTIRDISERVETQAVLRSNAQFAETLLGIVSHDLRNPLAAITTAGELLEDEVGAEQAPVVRRLLSSARRMQGMIATLLDLTRGRLGGGIPVSPEPIDLRETADHVLEELRLANPGRRIDCGVSGDTSGEFDPERMAQVFSNLLTNALRYSPADSVVSLTLRGKDGEVVAEVHNQGDPIAPDKLPTLFDPFSRGQEERMRRSEGGLGLGLYIVDQIVRAHSGAIDVRSSAGEGTCFRICLPRRPAA